MRELILGGRVVDPARQFDEPADILVEDGKVAGVERPGGFQGLRDVSVFDAAGCLVTPGLLDIHVHLREPGQEWKETVETGARAAVAGGFTTVCCMPNTDPTIDNESVVKFVLERAARADLARVLPIGAITMGRHGKELSPMLELREAGCVAFSDDGAPVRSALLMRRALEYNKMLGSVLTVHEEVESLCEGFSMNESALSLKMGLKGMPGAAEDIMIARDIELARLTGGRVHFCHVSTARGVVLIRRAKEDGIAVTAETAPHYFTLTEQAVEGFNTAAKMSMPLRGEEDRDALLQGLADGTLDCIASDHAPHEADSKAREFGAASFGILGLQTTVPLALAKVREGKLGLSRVIEALTVAPAKCFHLPVPSLAPGAPADLTIIDPDRKSVLTPEQIRSKSKNTPFMGWELQGHAVRTLVGGRQVFHIAELEEK